MIVYALCVVFCFLMLSGFAALLMAWWLNRSNNKGDSKGEFKHFSKYPLQYISKEDRWRSFY